VQIPEEKKIKMRYARFPGIPAGNFMKANSREFQGIPEGNSRWP